MESKMGIRYMRHAVQETYQNHGVAALIVIIGIFLLSSWVRCILFFAISVVFLTTVVAALIKDWRPRKRVQSKGKAVFITGCDSGFGHYLAQRLDDRGYHVFAGCLQPEGKGAADLKKSTSSKLHIVPIDVTSDDSVANAAQYTITNLKENSLWAVVNNAGMCDGADFLWTNLDIIQRVFDVNTNGVMRVTKAFLPHLVRSNGRVIAVASAAGRYSYPCLTSYSMSKQAVIALCDGLRQEMYPFGVKVVTIEPWMFKTAINEESLVVNNINKTWDKAPEEVKKLFSESYFENYKKSVNRFINWSISDKPQQVVDCMEEAVAAENPKYSYNPGTLKSRLSYWMLIRLPKPIADKIVCDHLKTFEIVGNR